MFAGIEPCVDDFLVSKFSISFFTSLLETDRKLKLSGMDHLNANMVLKFIYTTTLYSE